MSTSPKSSLPLLIVIWGILLSSLFLELLWLIQPAEFIFISDIFSLGNLSFPVFSLISISIVLFLFAKWEKLQFFVIISPIFLALASILILAIKPSICLWLWVFVFGIFWLWTVLGLWLHFAQRRLIFTGWALISCTMMLYLYADSLFYRLTKAHIGLVHLWQLQFKSSWESISSSLDAMNEALFLPISFVALNLILLLFLRREVKFSRAFKPVFFAVIIQLFASWFVFDHIVQQTPLVNYLMAKYDFSDIPLPGSGILKNLEKTNPLAENLRLTMNNYHRKGQFKWISRDRKNILLLVLESVRAHEFEKNMPKLRKLAKKGIYFKNHRSASNFTKSALFGLYHSSYPFDFLESYTRLPESSFLTFLKSENYQLFRIFSKWGKVEGAMYDDFISVEIPKKTSEDGFENGKPVEWEVPTREDQVKLISRNAEKILARTQEILAKDGPKFIDSYLYNSHFNYYFPEEYTKYKPILPPRFALYQLDHTEENVTGLLNRYRNSLYYMDECLDKFFKEFYAKGYDKDTLVVIIGDHGQSLGDDGFFGHASGPHGYQFHVPCILLGAGIEPQEYDSISQHPDLIPTIGEILGFQVKNVAGKNLFKEKRNFSIEQEHSKLGRFIVRRKNIMSIYDCDFAKRPRWLITVGHKFEIDERFFALYSEKGIPILAKTIDDDFKMLKAEGTFEK